MLYWHRYHVIMRPFFYAMCLIGFTGCSSIQKAFFPKPTAVEAMDIVSTAVETTNLWWPITFAGFLALLAGIVNLVFLRGGAKLLVIGILLAITPPIIEMVMESVMPWVGVIVGLIGLGLLGTVFGRWYGRRDIVNRAQARASYIVGNGKSVLTKGQTADVLNHLGDSNFKADYPIKGR